MIGAVLPGDVKINLFLCHGRFASDKFLISDPMRLQTCSCIFIYCTDDGQRITLIFCQFTGWFYKNLLIFIRQIFSHIKEHITHPVFYQLLCQNCYTV